MHETFFVKAIWDNETQVYYSISNIDGLHVEALTLAAFNEIVADIVDELMEANHF